MLNFQVALKEIENGQFAPVYLFFGEESYLREELLSKLYRAFVGDQSDFGREKIEGAALDLEEVINRADEGGLFSRKRLLIVDNPPYLVPPRKAESNKDQEVSEKQQELEKSSADLLLAYFERLGSLMADTIIVFLSSGVDRRKRIYKVLDKQGTVVECLPLKGDALIDWINQKVAALGKTIERSAVDRLLMAGDQNLHYLSNELEKYAIYLGEKENVITGRTVDLLFSGDLEGNVFKLADALAEGYPTRARGMLNLLLSKNEKPLLIFFMLVRHYRLLLQARCLVEEGMPLTEITSTLAVHPFVARKLRDQASKLERRNLEDVYVALQKADMQIKTGVFDPVQALRLTLSRIDYLQNIAS
jgi:DNA polymerase III subunit delta